MMLLNPYRFAASGGGGSGHRYWRWSGFALSGSFLEISELRLVGSSGLLFPVSGASSNTPAGGSSGSGLVSDLWDGSTSTRTYWSAATATDPSFWISVDLGTPQEVTGIQIGAFDTENRFPTAISLYWSDDETTWTFAGSWSGLTYPGNYNSTGSLPI